MKKVDAWIEETVGALTDPIIVFPGGWEDTLPDWIKGEIKLRRLAQLMKGETGVAADAEALAYLNTASLVAPMHPDWVEIYMHVLTSVMGDKVPQDLRKENLNSYQEGLLREFKEWLWQQRIKARKERQRGERAEARAAAEARAPKQLQMF